MKYLFSLIMVTLSAASVLAQETVYPAAEQSQVTAITNGTVHIGNGQVIENGTVVFDKGKIVSVGAGAQVPANAKVINANGKHVYPGLILSNSDLGLKEVGAGTRATNDVAEIGDINPNVRAIVAYNTDSKITNTLRSNGILIAHVVPQGGLLSGTSSLVQVDAWNWEDAAYSADNGVHLNVPSMINRRNPFAAVLGTQQQSDPVRASLDRITDVKNFLKEAKAYHEQAKHSSANLKYEAVKGLFSKKQKLFMHCDAVKEMLVAIDFAKELDLDVVIVGGSESYQIADLLKQHNIPVILNQMHSLPTMTDDDIDQPFKTPSVLQRAGVLFAINDEDGQTRGRNLMFNAGTAASYGLTKEQALSAITLNAARILGIAERTGSIEVGKDANIIISSGDILDMRSSIVSEAFIQGRQLDLNDKHKQLNDRYNHKYGLSKQN